MTDATARARRDAIRAEYAAEERASAAADAQDHDQSVLSVRVPATLAEALKVRAAAEQTSTSALIRRILVRSVHGDDAPVLTVSQVEEIARRVLRESA